MIRQKMIFALLAMVVFSILGCKSETREDKLSKYFNRLGIEKTAYIALLNPDYCGSCTDFSINYLLKRDNHYEKKIVIHTAELKREYSDKLKNAGYTFINGNQNELSRIGITLSACTIVLYENGEVINIRSLK